MGNAVENLKKLILEKNKALCYELMLMPTNSPRDRERESERDRERARERAREIEIEREREAG